MKKLYKLLIVMLLIISMFDTSYAFSENEKTRIQNVLEKYYDKLSLRSNDYQLQIFDRLIKKLELIKISKSDDIDILEKVIFLRDSINTQRSIVKKKKVGERYNSHDSLILYFSNDVFLNDEYIKKNIQKIENSKSVFLFRNKKNLKTDVLRQITKDLKSINPDILLFIDQEGGQINRFESFGKKNFEDYFDYKGFDLFDYQKLTQEEKLHLKDLFSGLYLPSPKSVYEKYILISDENKQYFLNSVAYITLYNISYHGVNTHPIVLDLDRGNPAISGLDRSFSSNVEDYKKYIDAYVKASSETGIILYGKHFPGHGEGSVDTHSGILTYSDNLDYLNDNLEVFKYFLDSDVETKGIMTGHMYLPNSIKPDFDSLILKSDFILTDDLSMQGYKLAKGKELDGMFFSTNEVLKNNKLIIVDTVNNRGVK